MKKKQNKTKEVVITCVIILLFALIIFLMKPSMTGNVIVDLTLSSEAVTLNYNNELINSSNNEFKLKPVIETITWSEQNYSYYQIEKAYFDADNVLNKVDKDDNKNQQVESSNIFNVIFENQLDNGDIITILIKSGNQGDLWLCDINEQCSSPGYGLINYNGSEEIQYNITLSNLDSSKKSFNINIPGQIKIDLITSSKGNLSYAYYNPLDKLSKINVKDSSLLDTSNNKLLDIKFDKKINNNELINLYLTGNPSTYYLCEVSNFCNINNYGSIQYNGQAGWYNISVINLNEEKSWLNLVGNAKLDYINVTHPFLSYYNSTNLSYSYNESITTDDLEVSQDSSIGVFNYNSYGNVSYYNSVDLGNTWNLIENNTINLDNISKIKFKIILHDENAIFNNFTFNYKKDIPSYYEVQNSGYVNVIKGNDTVINSSNVIINLRTDNNVYNALIKIEDANYTGKLNIFKNITIDDSIKNNLINATLRFYYSDELLNSLNIDESSLKIGYYNENNWTFLDSVINKDENYVEVTINHFSIYGLFGEDKIQQSQTGSGSGGGNSGGSSNRKSIVANQSEAKTIEPENLEEKQTNKTTNQEELKTESNPLTGEVVYKNNNTKLTTNTIIIIILVAIILILIVYRIFRKKR